MKIILIIPQAIFNIFDLSFLNMKVLVKIKESIICPRNSKINAYNK